MTKHKADIFTVVESVPNWFSARREDDLIPVESEVTPTTAIEASSELGVSTPRQPKLPTGQRLARTRGRQPKGPSVLPDGTGPTRQRLRLVIPRLPKGATN